MKVDAGPRARPPGPGNGPGTAMPAKKSARLTKLVSVPSRGVGSQRICFELLRPSAQEGAGPARPHASIAAEDRLDVAPP